MNQFWVLASGSAGNAALLQTPAGGVLIDCGIPPRVIGYRLASVGLRWESVSAAVLTHTHSDHWKEQSVLELYRRRVPLFLHAKQFSHLLGTSEAMAAMAKAGLIRHYAAKELFAPLPELECRAVQVPHDSDPTFALRFDSAAGSLGYAADVGEPTQSLAEAFAGVGVLALEFNHDVELQRRSRRPAFLIERVLGRFGHLSNAQAAAFCGAVPGFGALIQLHLSRECNTRVLAAAAGRAAVPSTVELFTAPQDSVCGPVRLRLGEVKGSCEIAFADPAFQPELPGLA